DMDDLLATRRNFMLGPWIASARAWGTTAAEQALYERNARNLITLWGDGESPLHEYANRQWSGLINDFYRKRWAQFFEMLQQSLRTQTEPDLKYFEQHIKEWEWSWVNEQRSFPVQPAGSSITKALQLYSKYRSVINAAYE
ncbi:MAG TPA: alpha-N-acetylglucosaminidase C-terminal domain-containing protein, partial [Niastella sp.]